MACRITPHIYQLAGWVLPTRTARTDYTRLEESCQVPITSDFVKEGRSFWTHAFHICVSGDIFFSHFLHRSLARSRVGNGSWVPWPRSVERGQLLQATATVKLTDPNKVSTQ